MISFSSNQMNKQEEEMCVATFVWPFAMFSSKPKQHEDQILEKYFALDERERNKEKERQRKLTYQRFRLSCGFHTQYIRRRADKHISFLSEQTQAWNSPIIFHVKNLMSGYYNTQSIRVDGIAPIASWDLKLTIYLISLW